MKESVGKRRVQGIGTEGEREKERQRAKVKPESNKRLRICDSRRPKKLSSNFLTYL